MSAKLKKPGRKAREIVAKVGLPESLRAQVATLTAQLKKVSSWDRDKVAEATAKIVDTQNLLEAAELREAPAPKSIGVPKAKFALVLIGAIDLDGLNSRQACADDERETAQLARNILTAGGIQQPVGLMAKGKRFVLIWGHRRHAAAIIAKLKSIPAFVYSALTPAQFQTLRSNENAQRRDLNPIEEAMDVVRLVDEFMEGKNKIPGLSSVEGYEDAIEKVAHHLGKSVRWVADRAYVARLTGDVRQLVIVEALDGDRAGAQVVYRADLESLLQIKGEVIALDVFQQQWIAYVTFPLPDGKVKQIGPLVYTFPKHKE